ncbi:MAG: hypothetical protein LBL90_11755 [Prevotellaceae bacterium]|jgi:hypothetical protein|nr:hypothetical protein [Prevotellaceae bacterium]
MIYIIGMMSVWILVSMLVKTLLFSEQGKQELLPEELMGATHDVFQLEEPTEIPIKDNTMGSALSEDDFEVEYESIEMDEMGDLSFDDSAGDDDNVTQEGSIIGFKEMQQMVAIVEDDKPLSDFDNKSLEDARRTIKQIEDTDFFEKMVKTKEDISRRIDEIFNNINS